MPSAAITIGVYGGLAVAAFSKILLRYAWQRITEPRGRHQYLSLIHI